MAKIEMLRVLAETARRLIEDLGGRVNVDGLTLYAEDCDRQAERLGSGDPGLMGEPDPRS